MRIFLKTFLVALVCASALCGPADAQFDPLKNNRVIVVLDNLAIRDTHSAYFNELRAQGFNLDFKVLSQEAFNLQEFGEYLYDHMILFASSETDLKNLKIDKILDFFDSGHNVVFAGDVDTTKAFRSLANNLGVEFDAFGSKVYDHVKHAEGGDHSLISTNNHIKENAFHDLSASDSVLYRGIGMTLTPYENFQVFGVLRGGEYTHSRLENVGGSKALTAGSNVVLVAGIQGRNNARVIITGSLDLFSNELYAKSKNANKAFTLSITNWAFQLRGNIRIENVFHHFQNDASFQPHEYKVYDDITYETSIVSYNLKTKSWEPFVSNELQLEFIMLDPYIRMPLTNVKGSSKYIASFRAPDKYGVFQFKVTFKKPGYTFLTSATKITVRPFKHNEYERYLFEASPYYVTVFASLGGFVLFAVFFLFNKDSAPKGKKDKKD